MLPQSKFHLHDLSLQYTAVIKLIMALFESLLLKCRTPSESEIKRLEEQVVHQSKTLCRDFIFLKLKENGLVDKDIYDVNDPQNINFKPKQGQIKPGPTDVSKELINIAAVFETQYPNLFVDDIGNFLKLSFHNHTPAQIQSVFKSVAAEIFHGHITWARIVALFIFTSSLTVDCVKQGQAKYGDVIIEAMQKFIRKRLAHWIACRGGWSGLLDHFQQSQYPKWQLWVAPCIGLLFGIILSFIS